MKIVTPKFFDRLMRGWKSGIAAALIVISITGWVRGWLDVNGLTQFLCAVIFTIFVFILAAYIHGRLVYIPPAFVDEMNCDGGGECKFATADRLAEACKLTKPFYGTDYVDCAIAEQWRLKNPTAFLEVSNEEGELCSCFGILGLNESCFDEFINGRVKDNELKSADILDSEATKKASRLYLSGVVVRDPGTIQGAKRARIMAWCILAFIKKQFGLRRSRHLYALAVSEEGERMLRHSGFAVVTPKEQRHDKHNLYCFELTSDSWRRLAGKIADCSRSCRMSF